MQISLGKRIAIFFKSKGKILNMTNEETLLTIKEERICKRLLNSPSPHAQRAQALLAVNKGHSHTQAAAESGLTPGQVSYWLAKFRKQRISIFPELLVNPTNPVSEITVESPDEVSEVSTEVSSITMEEVNNTELPNKDKKKKKKKKQKLRTTKKKKMGNKKKDKKGKKGKKKDLKKGKKAKKNKKGKKGKK